MTDTLNLEAATPAELRAECDRLGLTYRAKDDRKALARKIAKTHEQPAEPVDTFEAAVAAVLAGADPIAVADALVEDVAAADRMERMSLASVEAKTMKAWRKSGAKGAPPSTPNLDALNDEEKTAKRTPLGAKRSTSAKSSTPATPKPVGLCEQRYVAARDSMKTQRAAHERRVGVKLSDDDVRAHMRAVLVEHPTATCGGELLVARWTVGMSMDRYRWNTLWSEVVAEHAAAS